MRRPRLRPAGPRLLRRGLAGAAAAGLAVAPVASAQEWVELEASRQANGVSRLEVSVEYGAGELSVEPARPGRLYEYRIRYDAARLRPARRWSEEDGVGRLSVSLEGAEGGEADVDRSRARQRWGEVGSLSVGLSREVPTAFSLEAGAAETSLELGGIPLARFRFRTGASDTQLRFGEPNPVRMEALELAAGAASFRAEGLGNARFETFRFKGGIGDVTLDFGGRWDRSARASLAMGVGSLQLRLPRDLGVEIRRSTFLTSFEAKGMAKAGNAYRTANWETARHRLEIDLDATLGTVSVEIGS